MSSRYTNKPTDWRKLDRDGAYRAIHKGSGGAGMMRLWSWLMMFGDVMEDGSVMMVRERVSEMSGVVMKQVDRWRLDLVRAGWLKRHIKNSRVWVHPVMQWWSDVQYRCVKDPKTGVCHAEFDACVTDDTKPHVSDGTQPPWYCGKMAEMELEHDRKAYDAWRQAGMIPTNYNGLSVMFVGTAGDMKPNNLFVDATQRYMKQLAWYKERDVINGEIGKVSTDIEKCNHALSMVDVYGGKYEGMDKEWWMKMHADLNVRLREWYARLKEHDEKRGECFVKGGDGVWK